MIINGCSVSCISLLLSANSAKNFCTLSTSSAATVSFIHFLVASASCMGIFSSHVNIGELLLYRHFTVSAAKLYSKILSYTSDNALIYLLVSLSFLASCLCVTSIHALWNSSVPSSFITFVTHPNTCALLPSNLSKVISPATGAPALYTLLRYTENLCLSSIGISRNRLFLYIS